jgi:serine/threonine protein kinase/beta-lactam-binding protein with PASTA domain
VTDRTVADPMIGRVLDGRYRVGPRIARGGMATVYEATDLRLDRVVAVKVMHAGLGDDDDFADRFVREARAAARLSHPNVVSVFDQGADGDTLFLVMEHVDGRTLRDLVRAEAPLAPARALALLDPVLAALGAAHQAGLVHRDVKPENVLLAEDGRVKVADFGLARAVSAHTQHTTTGILIGTVSYLSPELLLDGRADARSDVYSAGVVLYEMLTGAKPHEAASAIQVAYRHVHEDVPPPSGRVPGIPPYVDALVARATARDRALRPTDAQVLLRHVRRVRVALDHGVLEDPELTSDLTPTVPVQRLARGEDIDYVREDLPPGTEDLPTVLTPAQAVRRRSLLTRRGRPGPAVQDGPAAPPARDRPHRRRLPRRALLLLVVLGVAAAGWWIGLGRYTTTPGLLGLSPRAAQARAAAAGLDLEVAGRDFSETVPVGAVVSTDPAGGDHVVRDGVVRVVLSRGPERHQVPRVGNQVLDTAQQALQDARLTVGEASYAFSDAVAAGRVLRTDPPAGTALRRGAAVDLVVSKGPRPVPVPDVTGRTADAATAALRRLRLRAVRTSAHSDTVEAGDVVSQAPRSGRLLPGRTVRLVVSLGPVLVDVPRVVGRSTGDAQAALEAAGFAVDVTHVQYYIGLGVVVQQSPGSAERAPRGSTVTLSIV